MEINVQSRRVSKYLEGESSFSEAMNIEIDDLEESRIDTLNHMTAQKKKIERSYNAKVKAKFFSEGNLVWKTILPVGFKNKMYGKWSPN